MTDLEKITTAFADTLETIARFHACDFYDRDEDDDCTCAGCQAKFVLKQIGPWRQNIAKDRVGVEDVDPVDTSQRGAGAYPDRLYWHARERRLVGAFLGSVNQVRLGQILNRDPSIQDWDAILSVIRWVGTNVGSAVLETAGWRYNKYHEDREEDLQSRDVKTAERWSHVLGLLIGLAHNTVIKDERIKELAFEAYEKTLKLIQYVNRRLER